MVSATPAAKRPSQGISSFLNKTLNMESSIQFEAIGEFLGVVSRISRSLKTGKS